MLRLYETHEVRMPEPPPGRAELVVHLGVACDDVFTLRSAAASRQMRFNDYCVSVLAAVAAEWRAVGKAGVESGKTRHPWYPPRLPHAARGDAEIAEDGAQGQPAVENAARPSSAERLKAARKLLGLTQSAAAEVLGVHQPYISAWERGAHAVPWRALAEIEELARAAVKEER